MTPLQEAAVIRPPLDQDARKWIAAVIKGGSVVGGVQQQNVSTLIRALKRGGVWSSLDALWIFAAENATQSLIDIVGRRTAVLSGTAPTFTANRGYAGNATSAYIDFGVAASALTNFTQNSAHIGFYVQNGDGATNLYVGAGDSGSGFTSEIVNGIGASANFVIQSAGTTTSMTQGGQTGMHICDRQSSTVGSWARNGADTDANKTVTTSSSRATSNLTALARNRSGTYSQYSGSRLAMVSFGGSLGSMGRTNLANAVNAYMTAVGANTY